MNVGVWDQLPGLDPDKTPAERLEARIQPYEALSSPEPKGLADPEPFRRELRERLRRWPDLLEPYAPNASPDDAKPLWIEFRDLLWLLAGAAILWQFTLGLILVACVATWVFWEWRRSRRHRLASALKHRRCPDCGYDLRGAPIAMDPILIGIDLGPKRCSECGGVWPLLPPRTR